MFVFKNGVIFQDEFVNDCPVRCPILREPPVKAKKQRATSTKRHSATSEQLKKTDFTQLTFCSFLL